MPMRSPKIDIGVPCLYTSWNDEKGKEEIRPPSVDCRMHCRDCGFNPEEAARRLREGTFVEKDGVHTLVFKPLKGELEVEE